jgi:hypothetical protein
MSKAAHTYLPWFKYQQWPDRFSIGAYRRGSLCISIGTLIPKRIVTASGDESISEEEALANVDIVITAVNNHQELLTRLYNLVNAVDTMSDDGENSMKSLLMRADEARELIKKLTP